MKKYILNILIAGIIALPCHADFDLGMQFYTIKDYENAYNEFFEAAKFGDHNAQFNLGVMNLKGEHKQKNLVEAYVWFRMATQSEEYNKKGAHLKIFNKLTEDEKKDALKKYEQTYSSYNDGTIFNNLQPVLLPTHTEKRQQIIRRITPEYPVNAARAKNNSGVVDIIFSVDKDGTTRDHIVFGAVDERLKAAALEAIRASLYEPSLINGSPVVTNGVQTRYIFRISGAEYDEKAIQKNMDELKGKTISDPLAQFQYAYYLETAPYFTSKIKITDNPNTWYSKAALNGNGAASYFLGNNLLKGNRCEVDTNKSMVWLIKASQQDFGDAQYLLAIESFSGANLPKNEDRGLYWLKRAAKTNAIARIRLAWILSTHPDTKYRDGKLASDYFNSIPDSHADKQSYFRTAAAIAANNNDFKEAIKWQKKAIKDAEKLELPLETVNAQLASYEAKQPWRETP